MQPTINFGNAWRQPIQGAWMMTDPTLPTRQVRESLATLWRKPISDTCFLDLVLSVTTEHQHPHLQVEAFVEPSKFAVPQLITRCYLQNSKYLTAVGLPISKVSSIVPLTLISALASLVSVGMRMIWQMWSNECEEIRISIMGPDTLQL